MTASGCEYFGSPDADDAMGTLAAGDVYRALAASATEQGGCTWLQFEKDGRTCCVALRKDRVRLYTRAAADSAAGGGLAPSAESASASPTPRSAEGGGPAGGASDFSAESASTLSAPRGAEGGGSAAEVLDFSAESASTLSMRMQQKRATAAVWENSSLILLEGEIGLELDADNNTVGQKIGNGLDVWSALPYSTGGGHVIQDSAGTELPKEGVLQFAGMEVTDDPVDGKTVVHGLGVKLADRAPVPGVPLHAVLKPVGVAPPVPPEGRADGTTITVDDETGVWSVAQAPKADRLAAARKIGEAEFDGTADVTLAQMGAATAAQGAKADGLVSGSQTAAKATTATTATSAGSAATASYATAGLKAVSAAGVKILLGESNGTWGLYPDIDNSLSLGFGFKRWSQLFAGSPTINTSDERLKKDISAIDKKTALKLLSAVQPVTYKLIDGTSGRTHWGMVSQQIEQAMAAAGLTDKDFAGFIRSPKYDTYETGETDEEGIPVTVQRPVEDEYIYGLRYDEFIAPLLAGWQAQQEQLDEQQVQISALTARMAKLENSLPADL